MKTLLAALAAIAIVGCGGNGGGSSVDPAAWTYFGGAYRDGVRLGPAIIYLGTDGKAELDWKQPEDREYSGTWRRWELSGPDRISLAWLRGADYDTMTATLPDGIILKCAADRSAPYNLPGF